MDEEYAYLSINKNIKNKNTMKDIIFSCEELRKNKENCFENVIKQYQEIIKIKKDIQVMKQ